LFSCSVEKNWGIKERRRGGQRVRVRGEDRRKERSSSERVLDLNLKKYPQSDALNE